MSDSSAAGWLRHSGATRLFHREEPARGAAGERGGDGGVAFEVAVRWGGTRRRRARWVEEHAPPRLNADHLRIDRHAQARASELAEAKAKGQAVRRVSTRF